MGRTAHDHGSPWLWLALSSLFYSSPSALFLFLPASNQYCMIASCSLDYASECCHFVFVHQVLSCIIKEMTRTFFKNTYFLSLFSLSNLHPFPFFFLCSKKISFLALTNVISNVLGLGFRDIHFYSLWKSNLHVQ